MLPSCKVFFNKYYVEYICTSVYSSCLKQQLRCYAPRKSSLTSSLAKEPRALSASVTSDDILRTPYPEELESIAPNIAPSFNFAAYVNRSYTLQKLVDLGVDLSKLEKTPEVGEFVLRLDFERNVKPYLQFLNDVGVAPENFGKILTKNVLIFKESLENLSVRINYLESKNFSKENIVEIITRNPLWLTNTVSNIDRRLGWFQTTYELSGDEVRKLVVSLPQIVTSNPKTITLNNFVFEEEMGMPKPMMKQILLKNPRIFITSQRKLLAAFEYVYKEMNASLYYIGAQPDILRMRIQNIKERHLFLKSLGRAQYNPKLPGYISLDAFAHSDDIEFADQIAKSSILSFTLFIKTL